MKSSRKHDETHPFDHTGIKRIIVDKNGCYGIDNFGKYFRIGFESIVDVYAVDNRHLIGELTDIDILNKKEGMPDTVIYLACKNIHGKDTLQAIPINTIDKWEVLEKDEVEEE